LEIDLNIAANDPAQLLESLPERSGAELSFGIVLGPERGALSRAPHDMRLIATITQHVVAAAGLLVSDMVKASAVRSYKAMDGLFWNQFHLQRESRDAKRG
jgi:hypothetical protein